MRQLLGRRDVGRVMEGVTRGPMRDRVREALRRLDLSTEEEAALEAWVESLPASLSLGPFDLCIYRE